MIMLDGLDLRENYPKLELIEQTEETKINGEVRFIQIWTLLNKDQKKEMEQFLKSNFDIFAWSIAKMQGISPTVIYFSLNVSPVVHPVTQKKRKFAHERVKVVKKTKKLLKADFIREVYYPDWLSNVVMVKKMSWK